MKSKRTLFIIFTVLFFSLVLSLFLVRREVVFENQSEFELFIKIPVEKGYRINSQKQLDEKRKIVEGFRDLNILFEEAEYINKISYLEDCFNVTDYDSEKRILISFSDNIVPQIENPEQIGFLWKQKFECYGTNYLNSRISIELTNSQIPYSIYSGYRRRLVDGRSFTVKELEAGSMVCMAKKGLGICYLQGEEFCFREYEPGDVISLFVYSQDGSVKKESEIRLTIVGLFEDPFNEGYNICCPSNLFLSGEIPDYIIKSVSGHLIDSHMIMTVSFSDCDSLIKAVKVAEKQLGKDYVIETSFTHSQLSLLLNRDKYTEIIVCLIVLLIVICLHVIRKNNQYAVK